MAADENTSKMYHPLRGNVTGRGIDFDENGISSSDISRQRLFDEECSVEGSVRCFQCENPNFSASISKFQ